MQTDTGKPAPFVQALTGRTGSRRSSNQTCADGILSRTDGSDSSRRHMMSRTDRRRSRIGVAAHGVVGRDLCGRPHGPHFDVGSPQLALECSDRLGILPEPGRGDRALSEGGIQHPLTLDKLCSERPCRFLHAAEARVCRCDLIRATFEFVLQFEHMRRAGGNGSVRLLLPVPSRVRRAGPPALAAQATRSPAFAPRHRRPASALQPDQQRAGTESAKMKCATLDSDETAKCCRRQAATNIYDSFIARSRNALVMTDTELRDIARAATTGLSRMPNIG